MISPLRLSVDAMGGDYGPSVTIPAVVNVLRRFAEISIDVVGLEPVIRQQFALLKAQDLFSTHRCQIIHAPDCVRMDDMPAVALRTKKESSMRYALNRVKTGEVHACVSAGNTGALMMMARYVLKMVPGIERPAIIYALPCDNAQGEPSHVRVLDLGANVDCTPEHLLQFAVMASVFSQAVDGYAQPRVGLLNIGTESNKGSECIKATDRLLRSLQHLNYSGYIEAHAMYQGAADVVVCDGFVGNVALKSSEGVAHMIFEAIKRECRHSLWTRCLALAVRPLLKRVVKRLDPEQHNGATLLGLRGVVLKSHGGASVAGFIRAIEETARVAQQKVPALIEQAWADHV